MFEIDLQFFAGEQSATVDGVTFEIEDDERPEPKLNDDGEIELEADPDEETDVQDESDDESLEQGKAEEDGEKQEEVKTDKNPTANAVIAERRKWQEKMKELERKAALADKLAKASGVEDLEVLQAKLDEAEAARRAKETGLTPQQVMLQIQQQREIEEMKRDLRKQKFDTEAERLKADPFFADIDDYRDEYEDIALRTGQTLEEVYMAKRGRIRMKEYEREVEQRLKANRDKKDKVKIDTTGNGEQSKQKTKIDLTPDERQMAKLAGMTPEEYYKYKKK